MAGNTKKGKSLKQERSIAKRFEGRTTFASGALPFDKADVLVKNVRIEAKRTDKSSLVFDKAWVEKLRRETLVSEFYAMEIEMLIEGVNERFYIVDEKEFRFILWVLTTPREEVIKALQEEEIYGTNNVSS